MATNQLSRLVAVLNNSKLQTTNNSAYQTILGLINAIQDIENQLNTQITNVNATLTTGLANTVLHANGLGIPPTFNPVVESDFGFTDITTANSTVIKHGLLPKLSGSATDYLDGTGAFTIPSGSGGGNGYPMELGQARI